ncbi:MAG: NAD(P)/FAD-dependent oxidoreductase [Lachnospiraceae bacterium]|nr:NAD(P)/FAD-dependent oxidoreductase [Lachnospiraceae bacterium]
MNKVIVIGGGAAGMMAAIAAADMGAQVTVFEKNEKLGKKLFITGKGRCNVTNAGDMENLFANVMTNEKFLYSAFYTYDNQAVMNFFEKAGCPLKVERGDRVFPVSDHSSDVIAALSRELKKRNVKIELNTGVKEVLVENTSSPDDAVSDKGELSKITGVILDNGKKVVADKVVIATGGISYASTGSTGDGYKFAEKTGHKLVECKPSLVPFNVKESWCQDAMGVSLKNVSLRLVCGKKEIYNGFGEMLITHFGISGPLALSASSYYVSKSKGETIAYIDLKPALDAEQLDKRVLRDFEEAKNKQFKNSLNHLFPQKLIPVMIDLSGIDPEKKVNIISKEERKRFVDLIKNLPLTITGVRDFKEAIITKGGVSVKDVNPSTMESKKIKGLYFAGEVLDLDALTGGYNLQIAWSTGYLAGINAGES